MIYATPSEEQTDLLQRHVFSWRCVPAKVIQRYVWLILVPGALVLILLSLTSLVLTGIVNYTITTQDGRLCHLTDPVGVDPTCQAMWILWIMTLGWYLGHFGLALMGYLMLSGDDNSQSRLGGYLCCVVLYPFAFLISIALIMVCALVLTRADRQNSWCCCFCWGTPTINVPDVVRQDPSDQTDEPGPIAKALLRCWYPCFYCRALSVHRL